MRPRLRADVYFVSTDDGAYLEHSDARLFLRGRAAYELLDRLVPLLDGRRNGSELVRGLPPAHRRAVSTLVEALRRADFTRDGRDDHPDEISPAYADLVSYLDACADGAGARFEGYRQTSLLLVGAGRTMPALVHAALRTGVRRVSLILTGERPTDRERCRRMAELAARLDPDASLTEVADVRWERHDASEQLSPYGAVVHVADRSAFDRALALNRAARDLGRPLVQCVYGPASARVGPVVGTTPAACWACAWFGLGRLPGPEGPDVCDGAPDADPVAGPVAGFLASVLVFEVFKACTGARPGPAVDRVVDVDLVTLAAVSRVLPPSPICRSCRGAR